MFIRKFADAGGNRINVVSKCLRALNVFFGIDIPGVGIEGYLGVDDQMFFFRQVHDHIRTFATLLGAEADLAPVIMVRAQAGAIEYILQD